MLPDTLLRELPTTHLTLWMQAPRLESSRHLINRMPADHYSSCLLWHSNRLTFSAVEQRYLEMSVWPLDDNPPLQTSFPNVGGYMLQE